MSYNPVSVNFVSTETLIVPMDSTYQNNGMYKAYGLIFRLLYENIINTNVNYKPIYVYWSINPSKTTITDVDFTATTKGFNTALGTGLHQYSGGPFIIQSQDLAYVKTLITTWNANNTPVVAIHELVNDTTIDTIAKLIRPPRVSVEDKNGGIPIAYLNAAGIPDYYVLSGSYAKAPVWTTNNVSVLTDTQINTGAFFGNTAQAQCKKLAYDIFISPHTDEKVWTQMPNTIPNLDNFFKLGGVGHFMCASISAIENNTHFLTTSGITSNNNGTSFFINTSEATNPLVQAVPTTDPQALPGGSEETWLHSATTYKAFTDVFAYFIRNNVQYDFMIAGQYQGSDVSPGATGAGALVYEGGHSYETDIPYTSNQENMYTKFVLNSVFLSVTKPLIDLTMSPNAITAGSSNNLTFSIKNIGGAQAKNATISVTLLPGMNPSGYSTAPTSITGDLIVGFTLTWSNITLDGGAAITFAVNNYTPSAPGGYPITFSATYGDELFATGQNNPYVINACSTLAVLPSNSPFLLVEKKVDGGDQTFIESGDSAVFTYTITNYGDQPAYDIELVDPNLFNYFNFGLGNVTPTPASIDTVNKKIVFKTTPDPQAVIIPPAQNAPANVLTVTVNATHKGNSVVPPEEIINKAKVNYVNRYPDPDVPLTSPDSNPATTYIVLPDISVDKSVDKANAAIGDILKYKIDITNPGNTVITQVKLTDLIPSGTSYVAGSLNVTTENISPAPTIAANFVAIPAPGKIDVTVTGNLEPIPISPDDPTDKITVEFDVKVESIPPNPVQNYAVVDYTYQIGDQQTGTIKGVNSNTVETNIASLQLVKTAPSAVKLGENLTYTISLTNNGKVALTNVKIVDTIPNGTSYVSSTGATFISQLGQVITLQVNSILVGATVNVTITVKVNTLPPGPAYTITNNISAIYTVDGVEKPPVTDDAITTVVEGKIDVNKGTVGNISNAKVGDTIPYKVDVTNTGNVPVTLTNLLDVIQPVGYTNPNTTNMPLNIILQPTQSTSITYNVLVTAVPPGSNPKIDNTVTVSFNYQVGQQTISDKMQDSYTVNIQTTDISVVKDVDKDNAAVGDILTYTVEVTNQGTINLDSITFSDFIPIGTSYVANSLNATTNIVPAPTISKQYVSTPTPKVEVIVTGTIKPLTDKITITFQVKVESITQNPIKNQSNVVYSYRVNPNEAPRTGAKDSNIVETNVASLLVDKNASSVVQLGENLTYTISLTNNGKVPLTNVKLVDTLPAGTSYISSTGATFISQLGQVVTLQVNSILVGATVNVTITVKVNTLPPGPAYTITNNISAIYTVDGVEKPPVTDTATTTVVEGKIDVNKGTVGNISNAKVGDTIPYKVEVTNTGNIPVTLTNLLDVIQPVGYTNPTTTNIPLNITLQPQQSTTLTYNVIVTALPPGTNPKIDNTVTVSFNYQVGQQTISGEQKDSYTVNIQTPDINVLKSVDKANAAVGDILTYKAEITNTGTVTVDSITFNDTLPSGTSYVAGSINVTANIPITTTVISTTPQVQVKVTGQLKPQVDKITITFQVKVDSIVINPIINKATVDYEYKVDPNSQITTGTKESNSVSTNIASLIISKTGPQFAEVGQNFTYSITLKNDGKVNLQNVVVKDTIPNETSFVNATAVGANIVSQTVNNKDVTITLDSIPQNTQVVVNIIVKVDKLPPSPYQVKNSAIAIYPIDGVEKPPVTSPPVTTTIQEGKILVKKSINGNIAYAQVGDTVTYKVEVTNTGNVPVTLTKFNDVIIQAANTSFQDQFSVGGNLLIPQPSSLTNIDLTTAAPSNVLQPQQPVEITYNVKLESLPADKRIDNTATVDFSYQIGQETKTSKASSSYTLNVEEIKVSLSKAVDKAYAEPGDVLKYTFVLNNQSSVDITNVYFYDPLPPNTTFKSGSFSFNPSLNPTQAPGALIGTIPKNSQIQVSFEVIVNANLTTSTNIPDKASLTYNYKLNPSGPDITGKPVESGTVNTKVEIPKIELLKSVSAQYVEVGDVLKYTLTVKNTGTVNAYDVEVLDILPPELQFVSGTLVVTPQQVGDVVTGTDPSYIKISIIRSNPNVVTITFDAKVLVRPASGKVENIAHANFKYSLDPQQPPTLTKKDIPSNIVTTTVQEIKVEIIKEADSNYVEVGQKLTYTVQITNKSTVPVDNKFTDQLPAVTQYVTGSFKVISGAATVTNNTAPNSNLIDVDVVGMQPQSSVIFSYEIKVLSLPPTPPVPQQITNSAKAVPSYKLYSGGPTITGKPVTDQVTTEVKLIKIEAIKSVEENVATIGDILHYTVRIINNGNVKAENVIFSDNVPDGTEFVEGSLTVDGVQIDSSPEAGINIGSIAPGQIVTVKFNVKVVAIPNPPNEPKAENTALVTFEVELDGVLQPRDPVSSNPVETELVKVQLEAIKTVDKDIAEVGDVLTYTVVIKNTGDVTIDNVIFNDKIPEGTELVGNQPVQNVNIGSIEPGKSKTITFQVKVVAKPCPPKLINKATITGSYIVETQRKLTIESNEVVTYVGVRIFKQISVDENLTIPEVKPDAEEILEVIADVEITYTNVIKTPIVTSYEGQQLTGWKLIVEGKLKQKIVYIADVPSQAVHAAEFDVPFSTFLVLPKDYKECQQVKVEGFIEDIFFKLVNKRTIFKNVTLMLQGKNIC